MIIGAASSVNKELQRECIHFLVKIECYPSRFRFHRCCPLAASVTELVCVCECLRVYVCLGVHVSFSCVTILDSDVHLNTNIQRNLKT